jgi:hypothetical protein
MSQVVYRVGVLTYQVVGAICALFFLACSAGAFFAKQYPPIAIFGFFVLMGMYMLLFSGHYEVSEAAVYHRSPLGHFRMKWSDVVGVEVGNYGSLILHGEGKRFALAPVAYWSGKQKAAAFEILKRKLETLRASVYASNVGDYKIHKNVRIRANED